MVRERTEKQKLRKYMANEIINLIEKSWLLHTIVIVKLQVVEIFAYGGHS